MASGPCRQEAGSNLNPTTPPNMVRTPEDSKDTKMAMLDDENRSLPIQKVLRSPLLGQLGDETGRLDSSNFINAISGVPLDQERKQTATTYSANGVGSKSRSRR
jgi:hypothetical protein